MNPTTGRQCGNLSMKTDDTNGTWRGLVTEAECNGGKHRSVDIMGGVDSVRWRAFEESGGITF